MPNNHVITREIGNLRGFSTDSIFLRPSNVADKAINLQKSPDGTLQLRRGYQCQIAEIGGMGINTFDDPDIDQIRTVCVSTDGFVYNKLTKQIFLYFYATVSGVITGVSNSNPALITSIAHGLQTGARITIRGIVTASPAAYPLNNLEFQVFVVISDLDHFQLYNLDGSPVDTSDTSKYPPYVSGGTWAISFTENRYLSFSIFVDPALIYNGSGQSINCRIIANRSAQINGNQTLVNSIPVFYGHNLSVGDIVQLYNNLGVLQQRTVTATTVYSVTVDGAPVSVSGYSFINQFFEIAFGKGFDVSSPYLISQFIAAITHITTGVTGLTVSVNGDTDWPAAFLEIVEPIIIDQNSPFIIDYWYWQQVNSTINPPMPGSANTQFQNSSDFENASMAAFDDIIYICNGWDYPQKYDGQTVYRAGMPLAPRPTVVDNTTFLSLPFLTGEEYQYAITYEQIDAKGHIIEGELSDIFDYRVDTGPAASNVTVNNLISTLGNNWNTNSAEAVGGFSTVYGPDINGYYYDLVSLDVDFTLKIGDIAYYLDRNGAIIVSTPPNSFILNVSPGHAVVPGDIITFFDTSVVFHQRRVVFTSDNSLTIQGAPVTVSGAHPRIFVFKNSLVFGNVAIVDTNQTDKTSILVKTNYPGANVHTIKVDDIVEFIDAQGNLQRRKVTFVDTTHVAISGISVDVSDLTLIYSINQRADALNFRRLNVNPIQMDAGDIISNNLRINIYRTKKGEKFSVDGLLYLVGSIPNNGLGTGVQVFIDAILDEDLGRTYANPDRAPNPPPISKYVKSFGNQVFYAGGERGKSENSDRVFFSNGNDAEAVPLATNNFNVPNIDDDITGIGVSGSTLVTTKNQSIWGATGSFVTGQIEIIQIAPGTNIGCVAHATIAAVGTLMYFLHTSGVYAITENQLFPTDAFGNPIPLSVSINSIFRKTNYLPQNKYVLKRAVAFNYTKENQYLLFLPCEDTQTTIRDANANSILLCYDYQEKNWFKWNNMNAAGGMVVVEDDLYFQERRFSRVDGNVANLYKQHRFYRLVDHSDHAGAQICEWVSSWEDLTQPEVRKKFSRCVLLMDRLSQLFQFNNPTIEFFTCLNRIPDLKDTKSVLYQTNNVRNSAWSKSPWGWNKWSGYQDSFISVNLKQGTVAKSIQIGFTIKGINMDISLAGFQLEAIPENRKTIVR